MEVPRGSRNKYEYDEERGLLRLDRHLFASAVFPADYGFIEGTRTEDGRHLDALVLVSERTRRGGIDDKLLCVSHQEWRDVDELQDVSERLREEVEHFFSVYKDLEAERATVSSAGPIVRPRSGRSRRRWSASPHSATVSGGGEI